MGTNYYWTPPQQDKCPTCGHDPSEPRVHIGKRSYGWLFHFHAPSGKDAPPRSWREWERALTSGGIISNEYGDEITLDEFRGIVNGTRTTPRCSIMVVDHWSVERGTLWEDDDGWPVSSLEFS